MKKKILHLTIGLFIIFIDQLTKYFARKYLPGNPKTLIKNVLVLYYHENTGSAWGMFGGKTIPLFILSLLLLSILLWVYTKIPETKHYELLKLIDVFIMAGAIGNAIDRIVFRFVTDFIYVELINFPIFNVADMFISVPAVLLFVLILTLYRKDDFEFLELKHGEKNDKQ